MNCQNHDTEICAEDPWLLVLDHASDFNLVQHIWPSNTVGSILLTSRNANLVSYLAMVQLAVRPMLDEEGTKLLLQRTGLRVSPSNTLQAAKIQVLLGGLPLTLDQIGDYISHRRLTFQQFCKIWKTDADTVACWMVDKASMHRTLRFIWSHSLTHLRRDARALFNLLCYLEPERIEESVLCQNPSLEDYMNNLLYDPIRYASVRLSI
jgi:hypothetical protein